MNIIDKRLGEIRNRRLELSKEAARLRALKTALGPSAVREMEGGSLYINETYDGTKRFSVSYYPPEGLKDHPALRRRLAKLAVDGRAVKEPDAANAGLRVTAHLKPLAGEGVIFSIKGEVPASCKLVPYEVEVPEKTETVTTPARKETRYRVECKPEKEGDK